MLKTLCAITTAAGLFAFAAEPTPEGGNINTNEIIADVDNGDITAPSFVLIREAEEFTINLDKRATNVVWTVDDTNSLDMATFLQVDTNWFPIARGTNIPPAKKIGEIGVKEIGEIQTNRYLTIIYHGKTNKFLMGLVGKEEWPSQKRNRLEPKPQPVKR